MDFPQTSTATRYSGLGEHIALEIIKITIEFVQQSRRESSCQRCYSICCGFNYDGGLQAPSCIYASSGRSNSNKLCYFKVGSTSQY